MISIFRTASISLRTSPRRFINTGGLNNIIENDVPSSIQVRNVSEHGIELGDGLLISSPCIFLNGKVFLWKTPTGKLWNGWTNDLFEVFDVVVPKPELLLLGTGKSLVPLPPTIRKYLQQIGVQTDVMDTRNAASTFNLLAEEGRRVSAALLPLVPQS